MTSIFKWVLILLVAIPLCLDLSYTLLQKINPEQLVYLVEDKIKSIGFIEGVVNVRNWHFWCLDKNMRICTINVSVKEEANPDKIRLEIEKKLVGKFVEKLTVHIT
jgi:Co/Zn/Cd efflux system component